MNNMRVESETSERSISPFLFEIPLKFVDSIFTPLIGEFVFLSRRVISCENNSVETKSILIVKSKFKYLKTFNFLEIINNDLVVFEYVIQ